MFLFSSLLESYGILFTLIIILTLMVKLGGAPFHF